MIVIDGNRTLSMSVQEYLEYKQLMGEIVTKWETK